MELRPDDRVLVVGSGPQVPLAEWAEQLTSGLLVVIAEGDAVYELRRSLRDSTNVMIIAASEDGTIPWRDGFFSVVCSPAASEPAGELARVLQPEGRTVTASG